MEQQSYPLSKVLIPSIDFLLAQHFNFVLFKKPFSQEICLLVDLQDQASNSFCFHSFDNNNHYTIKGKMYVNEAIAEVLNLEAPHPQSDVKISRGDYMNQVGYEQYVGDIIKEIRQGKISKCVAARKKRITLSGDFNPTETFINLVSKYGPAFCYMANTPLGLWMGATPELLLQKIDNRYFTVALAGTKKRNENRAWTEKEKDEHLIVADYIKKTIQDSGFEVAESSPVFDGGSGHLLHLKMDINFYATKSIHEALHPTPAVCGVPVSEAKEIILRHEGNNRSLYSGYLGLEGEAACYYVNLRCMEIFEDHADIYVGAGITADSNPTAEWLETEAKSEIMGKMLKNL